MSKIILRILSFIPAIFLVFMISGFSGQTGSESGDLSYKISIKLVEIKNTITGNQEQNNDRQLVMKDAVSIHKIVRKLAHMTEFCMFSLTVALVFLAFETGWKIRIPGTLGACFLLASLDEFHQMFVPNRGPSFGDVMIDTAGAAIGIFLIELVIGIVFLTKRKSKDHK